MTGGKAGRGKRSHTHRVHSTCEFSASPRSGYVESQSSWPGRAREVFVKELLKPVLPPYVELGSGKIADSRGCFSAEIDVVIFSAATLPPILIESSFGVYPAEACIYAIEIKSRLTADQSRDIVAKHQELKKLHYLPSAPNNIYQPIAPPTQIQRSKYSA